MKTLRLLWPILILALAIPLARAGSATWSVNAVSDDWNTAANWTPQTVPNGPSDVATFSSSSQTSVTLSSAITLSGLVFDASASSYTINIGQSTIGFFAGTGITNNSGVVQNFVLPKYEIFLDSGSAGDLCNFTISGGVSGSAAMYFGGGSAGTCTYLAKGPTASQTQGGIIDFAAAGSADHGVFTLEGSSFSGKASAFSTFSNTATGGSGLFELRGGTVSGAIGAFCTFVGSTNADNATFIVRGGSVEGALGGGLSFQEFSHGGRARIEVFGNGSLDISSNYAESVTIGSIEGDGDVFIGGAGSTHGAANLKVGANNLSTTFSGVIHDGGAGGGVGGSLTKAGHGRLTLNGANTYTGLTTVLAGALLATNTTGSATGTGPVQVSAGTLGGTGTIAGPVTITSDVHPAFLAPGTGRRAATLSLLSRLTFDAPATYKVDLDSGSATADKVVAFGLTIQSGAQIILADRGNSVLTHGLVFTIIDNTAAPPITGSFSNLPDGAIVSVNGNNLQASYTGGDGNDLTLTVVP